ncbi:DUF1508 domain-containing protein [Arthrobacter sp. I2-34]|uniref:DUF1508 domain-containing protein n=1 Tax=Arthrobacter hankyongi TaxID=2904801 RepID=A0ABS9L8X4_9MICC|nr:DUF1508 domain-containing protein [Arthrobacter hankyongi]MCG2623141.1 DUF1508 domain-containing protein [Arthrobacter hankyongi]
MAGRFEIYADGTDFRFRLTGEDHEVLAVSGLFRDKAGAAAAIFAVRENAAAGQIVEKSAPSTAEPAQGGRHDRPTGRRRLAGAPLHA